MIGLLALVAVLILAGAVAYAYQNRKDERGKLTVYGHMLQALVIAVLGCAALVAVVLTLNALDLLGAK